MESTSSRSPLTFLGIAGSLRRLSYNRGLIRAAVELAPAGITVIPYDIASVPLYNADVEAGQGQRGRREELLLNLPCDAHLLTLPVRFPAPLRLVQLPFVLPLLHLPEHLGLPFRSRTWRGQAGAWVGVPGR